MTRDGDDDGGRGLLACPFCGNQLARKIGRINPLARCVTDGCIVNAKMAVVNLDDPIDVERWNTRAAAQASAEPVANIREMLAVKLLGVNPDTLRWSEYGYETQRHYLRMADVAIAAIKSAPGDGVRQALERIRDFPHDDTACEQAMSALARAALASPLERVAGDGWRPIETARHKDGTRILAWDGKQQFICFFRGEHHKPHQDKPGWFDQHIRMKPTHWMPLGPSPSMTSTDREGK